MEKNRSSQLELFSQGRDALTDGAPRCDGFLARIHNYEKVIIGIIAFIISGAIIFCIGVEKGKAIGRANSFKRWDVVSKTAGFTLPDRQAVGKQASAAVRSALPVGRQTLPLKPQETLIKPAALENVAPAPQPVIKKEESAVALESKSTESYTVQVASYKNNITAQKEAQRLRKSGLESLVLAKGKYSVVCIGSFTEKNKAQEVLLKLKTKKQYQDCLLRRL
ncbi:MAG: SPOR domain-containing protein [Candidatus Omnitrophota bacterium]